MRSPTYLAFLTLSLSLLTIPGHARADYSTTHIGDTPVAVPAPHGMEEITQSHPEAKRMMETFTASMNRLLLGFMTRGDIEQLQRGNAPGFDRYALVQTFRQLENQHLGESDVRMIKQQMRGDKTRKLYDDLEAEIETEVRESSARFSQAYLEGKELGLKPGGMQVLGTLFELPNAISHAVLMKFQSNQGTTVMVMGNTTMVVNGKILYAYLYSDYTGKEDVDWIANTMKTWIVDINTANP